MSVLIVPALLTIVPTLVIKQSIALDVEWVILVGELMTLKKPLLVKVFLSRDEMEEFSKVFTFKSPSKTTEYIFLETKSRYLSIKDKQFFKVTGWWSIHERKQLTSMPDTYNFIVVCSFVK